MLDGPWLLRIRPRLLLGGMEVGAATLDGEFACLALRQAMCSGGRSCLVYVGSKGKGQWVTLVLLWLRRWWLPGLDLETLK
jgi:hypothetical protein